MADPIGATWRKSTRSGDGGECVEVADSLIATTGVVLVRDNEDPDGPRLTLTRTEWTAFLGGVHGGEFDL